MNWKKERIVLIIIKQTVTGKEIYSRFDGKMIFENFAQSFNLSQ